MSDPRPFSQRIGEAEHALRAILDRYLDAATMTFAQWTTLAVISRSPAPMPEEPLLQQIASGLAADRSVALAALDGLITRELVARSADAYPTVALTGTGTAQFQALRQYVGQATQRIYGDLPAEDLAVAGRILDTIAQRARADLERVA